MELFEILQKEMMEYDRDVGRIHHFLKVHSFAHIIGMGENLDSKTQFILEIVSIVHDIGIKPAIEKYGSDKGIYQEKEGIEPCRELLSKLQIEQDVMERVCFLVSCHHTYFLDEGLDYQILLEADFLVNAYENNLNKESIVEFRNRIFKTKTGIELLNTVYRLES